MAYPTAVNDQITDSVTQTNVEVLANSPAAAIGSLFQTSANASSLILQNAVSNQQNLNSVYSAVTSASIDRLLNKSK